MEKILLVDNDEHLLELLSIGLEDAGFHVSTASSGLEALERLTNGDFDVLVTDLVMPNINGEKLLQIVASEPRWQSMKTIVVSGIAAEAPELRKHLACDVYIAKGPLQNTLQYIGDTIRHFHRMKEMSRATAIGVDEIYSRHITRELLDFKLDTDIVLDHVTDGICKFNRAYQIVWVNRAFCTLVKRPEEKLLGRKLTALLTDESAGRFTAVIESEWRDIEARKFDIQLKDERTVRVRSMYTFDLGVDHSVVMWSDVTRLLLSEEQFENIVESSNDVIWTHDFDGRFTYVSRSVSRITGWNPDDLVGRPLWDFIPESDRTAFSSRLPRMMEVFRKRPPTLPSVIPLRFLRKDGSTRWGEVRSAPLRDQDDMVIGIRGVLADVTRHHEAEVERERMIGDQHAMMHELHHRVNENLQLVTSLARISKPISLENRLSAMGEVFAELYKSDSFSDVQIQPVIERVVDNTVANCNCGTSIRPVILATVKNLHIRNAVPITLLTAEATAKVIHEASGGAKLGLSVSIEPVSDSSLMVSITAAFEKADPEASPPPKPLPRNGGCADTQQFIDVLVSQFKGTSTTDRTDSAIRFTATLDISDRSPDSL